VLESAGSRPPHRSLRHAQPKKRARASGSGGGCAVDLRLRGARDHLRVGDTEREERHVVVVARGTDPGDEPVAQVRKGGVRQAGSVVAQRLQAGVDRARSRFDQPSL